MKSNFINDLSLENKLSKYLDKYFYSWLLRNGYIVRHKRIFDKNEQRKGKDVILYVKDNESKRIGQIIVDEKSTSHYLNKRIPTFAFELSYLDKSGNEKNGWLLDDEKETDMYALIWPDIKCNKYTNLTSKFGEKQAKWQQHINANDFCNAEIWLICKANLLNLLESNYNLTTKKLQEYSHEIRTIFNRTKTCTTKYNKDSPIKEYRFNYTSYLAEQPINLVIWKDIICKSATMKFFISKGNVFRLY